MTSLCGFSRDDVAALIAEMGEPPYRARQLFTWVQARGAASYEEMTDLPKALRTRLAERLPVRSSSIDACHDSDDGTQKLLVRLADGERVECVLIPEEPRRTICISTQVGCGVGCVFCASGADGVVRNLTPAEIVEQVHLVRDVCGERPTHVVVMGMGEPLHNVGALVPALRLLQDPEGLDLGARRITVSTSGPRQGFEDLIRAELKVKLAISLHASNDKLRRELVPRGGTGNIVELEDMASRWFEATGRDVTFEYVLIGGVNDSAEDAEALAGLCGPHRNLNVIPMNPVPFAPTLKAPGPKRTDAFLAILRKAGVVVHCRRQRGDDVAAACGQLRLSRQA